MKRIAVYLSVLFHVFVLSRLPALAAPADLLTDGLKATNDVKSGGPGYSEIFLPTLIGRIVQILLGLTGMVFLVIVIYAGIMYMTAAGEPDKVKKAKQMIFQSIIGLIIIVGAYSISSFIIDQLKGAV